LIILLDFLRPSFNAYSNYSNQLFLFKGGIKSVNMNRLVLCEATANVLAKCFHLLGLQTLEKM